MARTKVNSQSKKPRKVVKKNIALLGSVTRYLLSNPKILHGLPSNFELIILPDDDPEISFYNLKLLETYGSQGKPVVFVRLKTSKAVDVRLSQPSVYVPLAV
jgi:hypothetical protein